MSEPAERPAAAPTPAEPKAGAEAKSGADDLLQTLKAYEAPPLEQDPKFTLPASIKIQLNHARPQFNTQSAKAYAATDERTPGKAYIALLSPASLPVRHKAIQALKDFRHPNLMPLIASGVAAFTELAESRFVCVFEPPDGKKLSELLAERKTPFADRNIAQDIIVPLIDILQAFDKMDIGHGRINLDNLYWSDRLVIGECVSEPCGLSQPYLFEPIERIQCAPLGKGETDIRTDCYAVAVVALHLSLGLSELFKLEPAAYLPHALERGSYNLLTHNRDFSGFIQDLLRGAMNDTTAERWGPEQILSWLGGKRYNLIQPSSPRDATRSFSFHGEDYANRRALAHALFTHWDEAHEALKENRLARWMELSVHKPELGEALVHMTSSLEGDRSRTEKTKNDIISRVITLLDPEGPLRLKTLAVRVEGIGLLAADIMRSNRSDELQLIAEIIENDLPSFLSELRKEELSPEATNAIWRLQKLRLLIRQSSLGGGMERALYELNPALACLSPLVARSQVMDVGTLLQILDRMAREKAADSEVMDRHIAAFICARLSLQSEMRVAELSRLPMLATHPKLIALKLLASAQEKSRARKLPGLAGWMAVRVLPLLNQIHRRPLRRSMAAEIKRAAKSGNLRQLAQLLFSEALFYEDSMQFAQASELYHHFSARIDALKDTHAIAEKSIITGRAVALTIALGVWLTVVIITLQYSAF